LLYLNKLLSNWHKPINNLCLAEGTERKHNCNYLPCPFSDHDFVYISFNVGESISVGKSYWKLNNSILKEEDFIISFRYYWKIISRTDKMTLIWWDKMKLFIKDLIVLFEM